MRSIASLLCLFVTVPILAAVSSVAVARADAPVANPSAIGCGESSIITASPGVAASTPVYFSANGGSFNPPLITASDGATVTTTYTAPRTGGGIVTISVGTVPGAA